MFKKERQTLTCCVLCCVQGNPGTDGIPGAKGSAVSITMIQPSYSNYYK